MFAIRLFALTLNGGSAERTTIQLSEIPELLKLFHEFREVEQ